MTNRCDVACKFCCLQIQFVASKKFNANLLSKSIRQFACFVSTFIYFFFYFEFDSVSFRRDSSVIETLLSMREIWGLNPGSVKSNTVSPTARHRCDVFSALCCPGAKPWKRAHLSFVVSRFGVITRVDYSENLMVLAISARLENEFMCYFKVPCPGF